ncbi:MAG TPA: metallophosphoesterase [Rhizobiaceae bacterium]|nr:metallophosphoesterase [Rhizobiaceae bacterium]
MTKADTGIHWLDARAPEGVRLYAIGDVHGRLDLLTQMHARIDEECARDGVANRLVVHLGDYVDRGPDSRGVIDCLIEACRREDMIALAGNHDIGLLEFLANPDPHGLFAQYGGVQTAASYGVDLDPGTEDAVCRSCEHLRRAVPRSHQEFIFSLPTSHVAGDFFFCHAGVMPGVPLDRQSTRDLIWIRDRFHNHPGLYDKVIVHGHTPVREPEVMPNRVNVDTHAFRSGVLTALVVDGAEKRFLQVGG